MVDTGIYNGFTFVDSLAKVDREVVLKTPVLSCIITGNHTEVKVIDIVTGLTLDTATVFTWTLNDVSMKAFKINYSLGANDKAVVVIDDVLYSDSVIQYGTCDTLQIYTRNDCANQYHDWDTDVGLLLVLLTNANEISPTFEEEQKLIINEKGQQEKTVRLVQKQRIQYYAPTNYLKIFNSLKINSYVAINTPQGLLDIYNIRVEVAEQGQSGYAIFTLSYEYKDILRSGSSCCDDINLDTILSGENDEGSETCVGFSVEIAGTTTLTVTLNNPPVGTPSYKWYKNNVYLTNASTLAVSGHGNYRVDVVIAGCRASATYYKDNVCSIFDISVTKTLNEINATASNVPPGETVTYEVIFEGTTVATALPYSALASGIYYVKATAGACTRLKGVFVQLQDEDCDFTASILQTGGELAAVTDATTPTYLWEFENGQGRSNYGSTATVQIGDRGIYWLNITNGGCSKEVYKYIEPTINTSVVVLHKMTGYQFNVVGIDLRLFPVPADELIITINNVIHTYTNEAAPSAANQYTINASGQIVTRSSTPFTNATIIIKTL